MARRVSQYLKVHSLQPAVPRLESIRSRILALAVFGTLVPAAITLGIGYQQNRRALSEKISEDLHIESAQAARTISISMKDQLHEMRLSASSREVTSDLSRFASGRGSIPSVGLREYLRSQLRRWPQYDELLVLDTQGRVLSSTGERSSSVQLPPGWQRTIAQENHLVGDAYWDERVGTGKVLIAVPVQLPDGTLLGAFAAEMTLGMVHAILTDFGADSGAGGAMYLTTDDGALLATSREMSARVLKTGMPALTFRRLLRAEHSTVVYQNFSGLSVIGTLERVPQMRWTVISEKSTDATLARIRSFRNIALLAVVLALAVVATTAYRLGHVIVRPLERLTQGAAVVAMGDLDVDLPRTDRGEVGALTTVFNHMVARLREGRQALDRTNAELVAKNAELERLSVTDGLTGLTNHRALMMRLGAEAVRSQRTDRPFAFLMADVDHFKQYNDELGHPAGDEVLKRIAAMLNEATRDVDCVARYGGEEFALLLPETDTVGAMEVAERIRSRVEAAEFPGRHITLSIGLAEFPKDSAEPADIIALADQALYAAKEAGRNRVVSSRRARRRKLPAAPRKKPAKKKG